MQLARRGKASRVTFFDSEENTALEAFWRLGDLIDRGLTVGVSTWSDLFGWAEGLAHQRGPLDIQIWGHAAPGAPLLGGQPLTLSRAQALRGVTSSLWFRGCETAQGWRGHRYMEVLADMIRAPVTAHCVVTHLWQGRGVTLEPGEEAWWALDGEGQPGCWATRMSIPAKFSRPES